MVFRQSFKYLKNEKISFIKVFLKLECLFYQNIYRYYIILFYIRRAILTQTNPKKGLIEKKTYVFILVIKTRIERRVVIY
jgi:hypothetical protein